MAKGQMRPTKEKRKPKSDKHKKDKAAAAPARFTTSPTAGASGSAGKKS
jgi:hypothetical protein